MHRYLSGLCSLVIFLFPLPGAEAAGLDELLTVEEIVERAVERSEAQIRAEVEAKFTARITTRIMGLDGDGKVTSTEKLLYSKYPLYGALYEELIEKEGRPLTGKEAKQEQKKRDEFIKEVKQRISEGKHPQPEDERRVTFNREFMARYKTTLVGTEDLRGYSCWVVYFEPKEGKLPVKRRMDEALNRSTGRIWVSQEDYGLVRAEFEMREPLRYLD